MSIKEKIEEFETLLQSIKRDFDPEKDQKINTRMSVIELLSNLISEISENNINLNIYQKDCDTITIVSKKYGNVDISRRYNYADV